MASNLLDELTARVWQSQTIFGQGRASFFARLHLGEKIDRPRQRSGFVK
jgi:hypothetical protein